MSSLEQHGSCLDRCSLLRSEIGSKRAALTGLPRVSIMPGPVLPSTAVRGHEGYGDPAIA